MKQICKLKQMNARRFSYYSEDSIELRDAKLQIETLS